MPAVRLKRLAGEDGDLRLLQGVLEAAPGYSIVVTGGPAGEDAARALVDDRPPDRADVDKSVFGIWRGDEIVGCADVLRGYPEPGTAFIGLLLLKERWQGIGLGADAYGALQSRLREWKCWKARLAVVETNRQALGFWRAMGFVPTGERPEYSGGRVRSHLVVMEKNLR
jgi:diamine N-acetyltransferase